MKPCEAKLVRSAILAFGASVLLAGCMGDAGTPTAEPSLAPALTATAEPTRLPRPSATATTEPTAPAVATATSQSRVELPRGWRYLGNERFGLQFAAPRAWVDATMPLREAPSFERFGRRLLLIADSTATAELLLQGGRPAEGAFAFGYLGAIAPDATDPAAALRTLLAAGAPSDSPPPAVSAVTVGGLPGARAEIGSDPLGLFGSQAALDRYLVVLLQEPAREEQALFVFGTIGDEDGETAAAVEQMASLMALPETRANIVGHLVSPAMAGGAVRRESTDVWTFNGSRSSFATVSLRPRNTSADLTLSLVAPSGEIIWTADDGFAGDEESIADVLLPESGTYLLEVSEFFSEAGAYELGLLVSSTPQFGGGGRLEIGQEVTSILAEGVEHTWTFRGTAGQEVSLVVTALESSLDLLVTVFAPDGRELVALDEGFAGDAEVLTGLDLPITGEYRLLVSGFAGRGGGYELSVDEGGESTVNFFDAGDLADGDNQRAFLNEDEAHAWFFNGRAGDEVVIEVLPLDANMDMDVWLLDPLLKELLMADEFLSGKSERIEFTLPVEGQFLILVREFFGEPGDYEISLDISGERLLEIAGPIVDGQPISGTLPAGTRLGWVFDGQAGDVIDVELIPLTAGRDVVLVLLNPAAVPVLTIDEGLSGAAELLDGYELPDTGQWTILVQEFFNEECQYELRLDR
jgi:hypothetical protein